jgi:ligand-binding SRPBCC domain-containing protein
MISIRSHSGMFTLETVQTLPISLEEAWDFFSSPGNLAKITPDYMGFKITSGVPERMFPGQIISYQIGLLPGIKSSWVTEITHVRERQFFVDEQRFGPYAMWHHEHWFFPCEGGVRMVDRVSYKLPFGILGKCVSPVIKKQLNRIFSYRIAKLEELFPQNK